MQKSYKSVASEEKKPQKRGSFVPGDPRINRTGRPKLGNTFSDIIREMATVKDMPDAKGTLVERKRAVVDKLYTKAVIDGDFPSIKYIIDRVDPIGNQPTTNGGMSIAILQAVIMQATGNHPEIRDEMIRVLENAETED